MTSTKAHVEIIHNPFSENEKTKILLNGHEADPDSKYSDYKNLNLQSWCNAIFDELKETCFEDYHLEFTGLAVDCEDMREAAEAAQEKGINFSYTDNVVKKNATERLSELEQLLDDVQKHPVFAPIIEGNQTFAELIDNAFDIFVVATMSSGKSTFINAMLGGDLLPSANQATTATIAEIIDNKSLPQGKYLVSRTNINGEIINEQQKLDLTQKENINPSLLSTWNSDIDTQQDDKNRTGKIQIEGNLTGIKLKNNNVKLRLSDTPGTNNSQNKNHGIITLEKIKDTALNPLIIYILNSANIAIDDDDNLLSKLAKMVEEQGKLAQDRFIFVLNKMDGYFCKENIQQGIENTKKYLEKHGIINPRVFPISASMAKLFRIEETTPELLEEPDKLSLTYYNKIINYCNENDLQQYMVLNSRIEERLKKVSNKTLKRTGLPALEAYISDYIEKYNEPYRIIRLTKAINLLLENARPQLENISSLRNKTQEELDSLRKILEDAKVKLNKSEEFNKFIDKLKSTEVGLSDEVANFFHQTNTKQFMPLIDSTEKYFSSNKKIKKEIAEKKIQSLKSSLSDMLNEFLAALTGLNKAKQNYQLEKLNDAYRKFIGNTFEGLLDKIDVKTKENLKTSTININQYLNISENYIQKENVRIGQEKIERSFWRKLLEFDFSEKYRDIIEEQDLVDLDSFWKDNRPKIESELSETLNQLSEEIKQNAINLTHDYCSELNHCFQEKVNEILSTLLRETEASDLEKRINEADEKLAILDEIEQTLTSISKVEVKGH
ncbi:dynamin family protein [Bisgaard Taxon 45]